MVHFKKISELDQADGFPRPEHPLISLNQISNSSNALKNMEITCDFHIIIPLHQVIAVCIFFDYSLPGHYFGASYYRPEIRGI